MMINDDKMIINDDRKKKIIYLKLVEGSFSLEKASSTFIFSNYLFNKIKINSLN